MFDWLRRRILPKELFQTIERMKKVTDTLEKNIEVSGNVNLSSPKTPKTKERRFVDRIENVNWGMLENRLKSLENRMGVSESQSGDGEPQELSFETILQNPKLIEKVNELIENPDKFAELQKNLKERLRGKESGWL